MKLSVIIPCLNEAEYIGAQLEALANQQRSEPWEVIVSDNGSTDRSLAIVEEYKTRVPNLRIVDASDRRGQAHAKNVGARAATGDALAFCDADDEVAPGWVAAIGEALSQYDFVASRFDVKKLNPPWLLDGRGSPQSTGLQTYRYPPYLPHAGGCGLGVRRALHEAVGGFDESWLLLEDTEYCFRVQLTGVPLHFAPDAVVHIRFPRTTRGVYRQAYSWGKYNVLLYKKYRPLGMPKLSWKDGVLAWIGIVKTLPAVRSKHGRAVWLWQFAWRTGRVHGCFQYRVLAL
jgi:glycosyltransferase involved in cell wall biosynthesis